MLGEILKTSAEITRGTFTAKFESGHIAYMGGDAPRPTELVVSALLGCSGLTFRGALDKSGVHYDKIVVDCEGQRQKESPTVFTFFKVKFHIWGKDLPLDRVNKAKQVADDLCPVLKTFIKSCPIETELIIEG